MNHGPGHVLHVHCRLDSVLAVRLNDPLFHPGRQLGLGVADINLAACNIILRPSVPSTWSGQ